MIRPILTAALLVAGLAATAGAQSVPPIKRTVDAARRTAAKVDAKTQAQQAVVAEPESTTARAPVPRGPVPRGPVPRTKPGTKPASPAAAPQTAATTAAGPQTAGAANPTLAIADTARGTRSTSVAERGGRSEVTFRREVFGYEAAGRRDPFLSLLASGELRPILSDLRLVAVAYDPTGRNSVAVMRDGSTNDQYRVKVGQTLGRMRVIQIQPKAVTFTIEEFGYSRREVLALGDSSTVRTQ